MGVKIVHCGDIHIGMNGGDKGYAMRRRAEVIKTFLKTVKFAQENGADLLLIAGDLFDNHNIGEEILKQISEAFSAFSGRVFITPGNHDFYSENSFWGKWELPLNVTVFKEDRTETLPELKVKIFGSPFVSPYKNAFDMPTATDDYINIALIHGDIASESAYCPISENGIKNSNMDYVALGHIHKRTEVTKSGNTCFAYCGCLEGQGFDETGEKGIYFGTIEKGKTSLEFIPLCSRQFIEEKADISKNSKSDEIPGLILRKIKEKYGKDITEWLFKIILTGETSVKFSCSKIREALENEVYFAKIKDKTSSPAEDLEKIARESSIRGVFAQKMLERRANTEDKSLENAVKLGLRAFFEEVSFDED